MTSIGHSKNARPHFSPDAPTEEGSRSMNRPDLPMDEETEEELP
jgi:hypothetical protein